MTADESLRINYRLRSTFFYRKLKEYDTLALPFTVAALYPVEHLYSWDERTGWGISESAFAYISHHADLHRIQVFCHPRLIKEHPVLLTYYRHIAALSLKGVQQLIGIDISRQEKGRPEGRERKPLSEEQLLAVVKLYNEHISLIVDSSLQSLTEAELHGLLLASTGTQIDGSWRNAIGVEAERVVQRLLVKEAVTRGLLAALIPRKGAPEVFDPARLDEQLGRIALYRGIMLKDETSLLFASDPDIAKIDAQGKTTFAIEVKGGADTAGALERYGAAKKSFEAARRSNPTVDTILVASCITPETMARIEQDSLISAFFNLTDLLSESVAYAAFIARIFTTKTA